MYSINLYNSSVCLAPLGIAKLSILKATPSSGNIVSILLFSLFAKAPSAFHNTAILASLEIKKFLGLSLS